MKNRLTKPGNRRVAPRAIIFTVCGLVTLGVASFSQAQSVIQSETLSAADAYDPGILDVSAGGLDAALWQGTSATRAERLLAAVRSDGLLKSTSAAITRDLVRAAVLSGGVPPRSDGQGEKASNYPEARLRTIIAMDDPSSLTAFLQRAPSLSNNPQLRAEIALISGDTNTACVTADAVQEGRAEPVWARLRAFCHVVRDELAAAELTTDLLRNSGYEDPPYFALMSQLLGFSEDIGSEDIGNVTLSSDPLIQTMAERAVLDVNYTENSRQAARLALDKGAEPDVRLAALWAADRALSDPNIQAVLADLAMPPDVPPDLSSEPELLGTLSPNTPLGAAIVLPDLDAALAAPETFGLGQLYQIAQSSGDVAQVAKAVDAMLARADSAGAFARFAAFLAPNIQRIPANIQAQFGIIRFVRAAVLRGDIGTLQGLYQASGEFSENRARIALIADALGNGFILGELGKDIETRLQADDASRPRAVRDTYIALALGAKLSESAALVLEDFTDDATDFRRADLATLTALDVAARGGARAETALRAALILGPSGPQSVDNTTLYAVIRALSTASLNTFAGRVAAEDFLSAIVSDAARTGPANDGSE